MLITPLPLAVRWAVGGGRRAVSGAANTPTRCSHIPASPILSILVRPDTLAVYHCNAICSGLHNHCVCNVKAHFHHHHHVVQPNGCPQVSD